MHEDITLTQEPSRHLAVAEFEATVEEIGSRIGLAFAEVGTWLAHHQIPPDGSALAHYRMNPHGFRVRAGFEVPMPITGDDHVVAFDLPAGPVLTAMHVGAYADLPKTYDAIRKHAAEHGLSLDETTMWEQYLTGPETPPEQTRTRVVWPIGT